LSEEMEDWLGKIVADAGTNVEKLRAIERALSALTYTLTPGELPDSVADAGDFLDYFLLESRQGYCTYFATAFVLLARAEGIPARYVQGYCIPLGEQGEARVYSNMAHAWPEVYLDGVGWIPFEPTPGYGRARLDSWKLRQPVDDFMPEGDSLSGEDSESALTAGDREYTPDADGTDEEEADSGEEKVTGYSWRLFGYTVSAVLCVCGILLAIDNALGRYRYRRMDPVERYRAEVFRNLKVLSRFGPERQEWETLEEFRERAGHISGLHREGSEMPLRFFENYERVVYGGEVVGEDMIKEVLEEREELFELLKEERKWVWLYCRIRLYLGKYRF
ncbi:MAG: transglutaminase-like domain-containing protein, partial [Acetatifactor sp.]|nr:transglutaminase-like domain-containing protein [Acetatifactor sp.]